MTRLQLREQLVHDLVLAAEYRAVNGRKIKPSIIPIVPSGDKAYETLGSQG
jgi:hypothetical protein